MAKMSKEKRDALRKRLKHKKKCHYCGVKVIKNIRSNLNAFGMPKIMPPNQATIDHVYSKWDIRRFTQTGGKVIVLACNKCNQDKNIKETCLMKDETYAMLYPADIKLTQLLNQ